MSRFLFPGSDIGTGLSDQGHGAQPLGLRRRAATKSAGSRRILAGDVLHKHMICMAKTGMAWRLACVLGSKSERLAPEAPE